MNRFTGKVCLVTGATAGMGLAISMRLAQEGGQVVICSSQKENVDETLALFKQKGLDVSGQVCDIGNQASRTKLVQFIDQKFGRLDVLVLNAGISIHLGEQLVITEEDYDQTFNINTKAQFFLIKEFKQLLKRSQSDPNILVNASVLGYSPDKFAGVYSMTKAAVINMVQWLAQELIEDDIRINAIAPGLVQTRMSNPEVTKTLTSKFSRPQKVMGKPEQIASAVAMICSEEGTFITGEIHAMQGILGKL
ncbi:dehydrogenase reductase sdr family member 4 [Stylonychia lemnae]|uniref:Dehydrogenase reductase sdr family member 4 n=1 Tax=Stylonychia lemnae TaxID=5949 RepID=A0A078AEM6_STYLE|nr:dehydrogenase reductase sdr family member 4 [Stylonychia lemnae]|eukprot:CDW80675.1 dehydrogenase reductase sdr family member 4 [Stylonychia lemnae]